MEVICLISYCISKIYKILKNNKYSNRTLNQSWQNIKNIYINNYNYLFKMLII